MNNDSTQKTKTTCGKCYKLNRGQSMCERHGKQLDKTGGGRFPEFEKCDECLKKK